MNIQLPSRTTTSRIIWAVLSAVFWIEYLHMVEMSIRWHYHHPFIWPTWLLGLFTMEMAILYNHPRAIAFRKRMDVPSYLLASLYLGASGVLLFLMNVGWNGCVYQGESEQWCMKTILNVWTYFPLTNPSVEMILLSFHGFGGRNEIVGAFATFLASSGLVLAMITMSSNELTFKQKLMPAVIIVACAECGFYTLFSITQTTASWPGIALFLLIATISLIIDRENIFGIREIQ